LFVLLSSQLCQAQPQPRPDPLDPTYQHDRWKTAPRDEVRDFRAFTTSFDGADDNDGDGASDLWRIPEWVSYELRVGIDQPEFEPRPSPWLTDGPLNQAGTAPRDESYRGSGFDRGHMCMRNHARRLGQNADWNTHTVLNCVPQMHAFNDGHWVSLEKWCAIWANGYGKVWVICGPAVVDQVGNRVPSQWIGDMGELRVAVPQRLFKIVVKESSNATRPDVIAFIYANDALLNDKSLEADHTPFLVPVREIEALTGLNFFSDLPVEDQDAIELAAASELWPPTPDPGGRGPSALSLRERATRMTTMSAISALYDADLPSELDTARDARVQQPVLQVGQCQPICCPTYRDARFVRRIFAVRRCR
jgi:DNA/RNA endonuclease G (NUC1)